MHQRAALDTGENSLIKVVLFIHRIAGEDQSASGSSQGLVGGGSHHIRIGNGAGMKACCHQSGDMCHIHHKNSAYFVSHFSEFLEIDGTGISGRTGDDQLRLVGDGKLAHLVIVQESVLIHAVGNDLKIFAGHVHR